MQKEDNCSKCGMFSSLCPSNISRKTGERLFRTWCLSCEKIRKDVWRQNNKDRHNLNSSQWAKRNTEKRKATITKYKNKNPDSGKNARATWKRNNIDRVNLATAIRRKRLRESTPKLDEFDLLFIKEIYDLARRRNMEVDHIIPLKHKMVCGLHTPHNLQLLTKSQNSKKLNTWSE